MYKKRDARAKLLFSCLFCRSRCRRRRSRCVNSLLFRWLTTSALAMFTLYHIPFRADVKSYSRYIIRHFEVARKTGSRWLSKCIVGLFWATHFQHGGKFVPQNSPTMHHLDPISRPISKWRMNGDGTELDESFTRRDHTHRTSYRSGWPGGFGTLILIFTSEYLLPSLFAFRHRFYSFTPATVQSYPHFDSDVNQ